MSDIKFDGNYQCGYCGKVFRGYATSGFLKHQKGCQAGYEKLEQAHQETAREILKRLKEEKGLCAPSSG